MGVGRGVGDGVGRAVGDGVGRAVGDDPALAVGLALGWDVAPGAGEDPADGSGSGALLDGDVLGASITSGGSGSFTGLRLETAVDTGGGRFSDDPEAAGCISTNETPATSMASAIAAAMLRPRPARPPRPIIVQAGRGCRSGGSTTGKEAGSTMGSSEWLEVMSAIVSTRAATCESPLRRGRSDQMNLG
ncbi:MAG: hypothetical protein JF887_11150 [Candidatus Dormibacteraeota bacterium]|uniref:Uncharacterized protein n=1 Tax=Candidatus Amunia macphersoniae TaxID=3127014 RepID=A0A934NAB6_9BACT|nr:hypothetical protein [Candidatus Dormibacteraeota bacterium]